MQASARTMLGISMWSHTPSGGSLQTNGGPCEGRIDGLAASGVLTALPQRLLHSRKGQYMWLHLSLQERATSMLVLVVRFTKQELAWRAAEWVSTREVVAQVEMHSESLQHSE